MRVGALRRPGAKRLGVLVQAASQRRHRSLVTPPIPSCSTSLSTFRVETPFTSASVTTATIACSDRRRGLRDDGTHRGQDSRRCCTRLPRTRRDRQSRRAPRRGATGRTPTATTWSATSRTRPPSSSRRCARTGPAASSPPGRSGAPTCRRAPSSAPSSCWRPAPPWSSRFTSTGPRSMTRAAFAARSSA